MQDDGLDEGVCAPAFVTFSNDADQKATKMNVKVVTYQGLLQVISWVLKGLECRVRAAELQVGEDGMADDTFWLTNLKGEPLSETRALDMCERVRDFVTYCTPSRTTKAVEWRMGPILIDNTHSSDVTHVTVLEASMRVGFLLEIASVMAGIGVDVRSAKVYTCDDCTEDPIVEDLMGEARLPRGAAEEARVIQLCVTEIDGGQLCEKSVQGVLFTLGLLLGKGHASTLVPSAKSYATRHAD